MVFRIIILVCLLINASSGAYSQNTYRRDIANVEYCSMIQISDSVTLLCGIENGSLKLAKWSTYSGYANWSRIYSEISLESMNMNMKIIATQNDRYVIIGTIKNETTYYDIFLIMMDSNFDTLWTKSIGGDYYDFGSSLALTYDNKFVSIGHIDNGTYWQAQINKIDMDGNIEWSSTIDSLGIYDPVPILQTSDSGFVFATTYNQNIYLAKIDKSGNFLWGERYPGTLNVSDLYYYSDTSYLLIGRTAGGTEDNIVLINTDQYANLKWKKEWGSPGYDGGSKIIKNHQNDITGLGWTTNKSSIAPYWAEITFFKLDPLGNEKWIYHFPNNGHQEFGLEIFQTSDYGYLILGSDREYTFNESTYKFEVISSNTVIIKTDFTGYHNPINDEETSLPFRVYPNPARDIIFINFEESTNNQKTINIYDCRGSKIKQVITNENNPEIRLPEIRGLIIVEVISNKNVYVKKLIKK